MKLERKTLLDALEAVRPGIAAKSVIEAFAHVWFDGKTLMAYNDTSLGVEVPFPSELQGGLRGNLLIGLLAASKARELELTGNGKDELLLKAGRMKLTLPLLPAKDSVWTFPATDDKKAVALTPEVLAAVQAVMLSTDDPEPSTPEKLGVTVEPDKDGALDLFTTDSLTISHAHCAAPKGYKAKRTTIPTPFWAEVLKRCAKGGKLWLADDCVIAKAEDGTRLFSKLVDVERPIAFHAAMERALPGGAKKKQTLPARLPLAFQRACVVLEGHDNESVAVTVKGDVMHMAAKSDYGDLKDEIPLDKVGDALTVNLDPVLVSRGVDKATDMLLTKECLALFREDGSVYLVSVCL